MAKSLSEKGLYQEAIRYYEPLQQVVDQVDASWLSELANCYIAVGQSAEAEECYRSLPNFDDDNSDDDDSDYESGIRKACSHLEQTKGESILSEDENMSDTISVASEKLEMQMTDAALGASDQDDAAEGSNTAMLTLTPAAKRARRLSLEKEAIERKNLRHLFAQRQSLKISLGQDEPHPKEQWMSITKSLIRNFMGEKAFFPDQRHHEFMGYTWQARQLASRKIREKVAIVSQPETGKLFRYVVELSPLTGV